MLFNCEIFISAEQKKAVSTPRNGFFDIYTEGSPKFTFSVYSTKTSLIDTTFKPFMPV
jgi:hypothetical protein